ncbi:ABC transporter substrate-binding protein [Streptomyces sp. NPDC056069]|uniref:ABC transporter substrate-binding protein n=1 Tax=Streptomyces sp. NPDC056069 TaxID=3345702 RepID=UPI0035DEBAF6
MSDATGSDTTGTSAADPGDGGGSGMWGFTDDRGTGLTAPRPPERVVAYVRAGAALLDLGIRPVAVYGSGHDGDLLDPVKAGGLAAAGVPYLGPGRALDEARVRELADLGGVDLVVDLTYDGKSPYALDEAAAERLGVPLVALSVGSELPLAAIVGRFVELAGALGAADGAAARERTAGAEAALRAVAGRSELTVLALSGAGPEQVYLARPHAWPELARLAELGVRFVDPGPGPGASWLTTDWEYAVGLGPDLVLFDSRANAVPPHRVPPGARLAPWNPETPPSPSAYARFFQDLTAALEDREP